MQPHGPYYLGGLSFGGAIAFEMAQQFHASGEFVGLVALMDTNLPTWRTYTSDRSALFSSRIYPFVAAFEHNYVAIRRAGVRAYLQQGLDGLRRRRQARHPPQQAGSSRWFDEFGFAFRNLGESLESEHRGR